MDVVSASQRPLFYRAFAENRHGWQIMSVDRGVQIGPPHRLQYTAIYIIMYAVKTPHSVVTIFCNASRVTQSFEAVVIRIIVQSVG